jgi:hypothetical protein
MNKTIWKFELETTDIQEKWLPVGAEILCIQTQNGKPCIWAIVEPVNELELRKFEIFGTGFIMEEATNRKYIGTYQLGNGQLVFHCFELIKLN